MNALILVKPNLKKAVPEVSNVSQSQNNNDDDDNINDNKAQVTSFEEDEIS